MESNQRSLQRKLGFFGMLKEAVKIPFKNPNFIIFTFLVSLPLLFSLSLYETMFTQTLIKAAQVLQKDEIIRIRIRQYFEFRFLWEQTSMSMVVDDLIGKVSHNFLLRVSSHLGIVHSSQLQLLIQHRL
ncbi:hypothetical protein RJT34_16174 [Clitoria ternatea]|uniref:Uncharacterized protein n=1 Tax=Clitoria ternatea TaxID=43366 RepID=A0AAN9J882_CLITE